MRTSEIPTVEIPEWTTTHLDGILLREVDRRLAEGLVRQRRLELDELRSGLRIRSRSWVGSVEFSTLRLRIRPKLTGGARYLARMIEVALGLEGMGFLPPDSQLDSEGDDLQEMVALLFSQATERVLRKGLRADYVEHEEWLPVVRGKILPDRQILERFGRLDRIACRFDELEQDVPDNRILAATVQEALRRVRTPTVRARLARLRAVLDSVCDARRWEPRSGFRELRYDRLNAHYREAHQLAELYWEGTGVRDLLALRGARSRAFLLDMNPLFERFVLRWLCRHLGPLGYGVDFQRSVRSVIRDGSTGRPFQALRPDLVLRRPDGIEVPMDTKYKLYEGGRPSPSDIYQVFLYGYALSGERPSRAVLLYPVEGDRPVMRALEIPGRMGHEGARLELVGLPLAGLLQSHDRGIQSTLGALVSAAGPAPTRVEAR